MKHSYAAFLEKNIFQFFVFVISFSHICTFFVQYSAKCLSWFKNSFTRIQFLKCTTHLRTCADIILLSSKHSRAAIIFYSKLAPRTQESLSSSLSCRLTCSSIKHVCKKSADKFILVDAPSFLGIFLFASYLRCQSFLALESWVIDQTVKSAMEKYIKIKVI